jgi:hypothetical protein
MPSLCRITSRQSEDHVPSFRVSIVSGVAVLAAAAGVTMAVPASATTYPPPGYFLCGAQNVYADGLNVHTCVRGDGGSTLQSVVATTGSNDTKITLCAEIVDARQSVVPASRNCAFVQGASGTVRSNPVSLSPGTYYGMSYFTSPSFFYGGETSPASVS